MERQGLAEAGSTLGMLQRGRGAGYFAALKAPPEDAASMLIACVTNDPRLDSQVESRAEYYANLIIATGTDLHPLAEHLLTRDDQDQCGSNTCLTVGTLGELARRGNGRASEILLDYVSYGNWWDWAVEELHESGRADYTAMAERIAGHFPDDDDLEKNLDASRIRREPWTQIIAANSRIGRVVGKLRDIAGTGSTYGRHWWKQLKPQAESVSELADIRVQDLLGCATSENAREVSRLVEQRVTPADERVLVEGLTSENDWQVWVCLRGLGEMKTPTACQAAMQFIVSHPETKGPRLGAATKAMAGAPASACLGIGRNWFQSPQWAFRYVAEGILEAHAEDADIPMLRAAVGVANATEDIYRLCSVIGCLKRFTNLGILPEVEQVFIDCQYSYARRRAARTMQKSCSERFADYWAFECMWDCESETRTIGCESVRLDAEAANNRLREILDDQYEADGVRACAKERLGR